MQTEKTKNGHLDRRHVLKGAGLAIGAAAAAATTAASGEPVATTENREPQHAGYRETESVKTYYRLARF
jgi:hypothetical protein